MNSNKSGMILIFLSIIALISITFSILTGITLQKSLEPNNFQLNPVLIPEFQNTNTLFSTTPMKRTAFTPTELNDLTKKLIIEYITIRYTVTGSSYLSRINQGIGDTDFQSTNASVLKLPSLDKYNNYTSAYSSFISGKDNDMAKITKLLSEKTTRSVRILKAPYKYQDRWRTEVEFIYKTPSTNSITEATKEKWEIDMELEPLTGFRPMSTILNYLRNNPSSLFGWSVKWIYKRRK